MKNFLHFILMFLLLAAFGGGCSRGGGEAELVAIDSLIAVSPDSALHALGRIDTASLGEGGRAYHSLLTYRAMKTCGIAVTDDSLTRRAWRWYEFHGPYERRICAMRYRATNAEEMGDSVTAMRWYKRTELAAREQGDDFSIGYALMSMAIFYQENYGVQQAIDKFRQADSLLSGIDPECALFCQKQLSQLYQNERWENDSVMRYLLHVDLAAEASHDTTMLADILTNRALYYFYKSNYQTAKEVATDAISRVGQHASAQCWHIASQSFAYLHMLDSATYYCENSPKATTVTDSSLLYRSKSMISVLKGNMQEAYDYELVSDSLAESERNNNLLEVLIIAEKNEENSQTAQQLDNANKELSTKECLIWGISIICVVLAVWLVVSKIKQKEAEKKFDMLHKLVHSQNRMQETDRSNLARVKRRYKKTKKQLKKAEQLVKNTKQQLDNERAAVSMAKKAQSSASRRANRAERDLSKTKDKLKRARQDRAQEKQRTQAVEHKLKHTIEEMEKLRIEQADTEIVNELYASMNTIFETVVDSMGEIAGERFQHGANAEKFMRRFDKLFEKSWTTDRVWQQIEEHINKTRRNILARLFAKHPELTPKERKLIMLIIMNFKPEAIAVCLKYKSPNVVASTKHNIKNKLHIDCDIAVYIQRMMEQPDN